jgi:uncharacterized protein (DUF2126 family)
MAPEEREIEEESSPMLARPPLGEFHARFESGPEPVREQQRSAAPYENRFRDVIHTALCVETRQGHLHVFMPSLGRLEDYLDLLAAVEKTASKLTTKVVLEGYEPPDYRLKRLQVTPDPGVIEVNIHPASS